MSGWGTLPLPSIVRPKPVDELLLEATVRSVGVNGIAGKVCRRIGMFEQVLCEAVVCLLPDCTMGVDTVSDWETFSLPNIVKQKARKSGLQAMLIRHTNWESECAYTQNERH